MSRLSELEGAVLGVVRAEGPCTAYAVRRTFRESPSPHWSGSAGAIYPLVERLQRRGLLRSRAQRASRRRGRLYQVTPAGLRALRDWLAPPLPDWVVGVPADPLRTRLRFLSVLSPGRRRAFLDEARSRLEDQIRIVREDCRECLDRSDAYRYLVARGALAALKARRSWLREVARVLGGGRAEPPW